LSQPFSIRFVDFDGRPIAGSRVEFSVGGDASGTFPNPYGVISYAEATTDANGVATPPPLTAGKGLGTGYVTARFAYPGTHLTDSVSMPFTVTTGDGKTSLELQDMWWAGFEENGWGLSVAQHDDRLFAVVFTYDANGQPTWHVLPAGYWAGGERYANFVGAWYSPRGTPYFAYDASRLVVGSNSIYSNLEFDYDTVGRMIVGPYPATTKSLRRQDFTGDKPSPIAGLGDMWWGGPSQNGWGISIMEQFGGLFSVWFTYDGAGLPTWFVMPGGTWTSVNTYEGAVYRTRSSGWPAYDAKRLQVIPAGTYRYRFQDLEHATFEYSVEGNSGSLSLIRQDF
jgi:hypothetical protein